MSYDEDNPGWPREPDVCPYCMESPCRCDGRGCDCGDAGRYFGVHSEDCPYNTASAAEIPEDDDIDF